MTENYIVSYSQDALDDLKEIWWFCLCSQDIDNIQKAFHNKQLVPINLEDYNT